MHRISRFRPSPAMIVAIVALVLSLGGTSYAAIVLPAGSVGTKQLKDNAVVSAKVKNGSLTTADISATSLSKLSRIAIAADSASVDANVGGRIAQVSIMAPKTGFVLVTGWVDTYYGTGQYYVRVWDDGAGTHSPYFNGTYVSAGETSCSNTAVFPVTAGEQRFSIRVEDNSSGLTAWGTITAQFIPYGATGSPTVLGDAVKGAAQPIH